MIDVTEQDVFCSPTNTHYFVNALFCARMIPDTSISIGMIIIFN